MRKLIALSLLLTIGFSLPKKSEAAVGVIPVAFAVAGSGESERGILGLGILTLGEMGALAGLVAGGVTAIFSPSLGGTICLYSLVLDKKSERPMFEENISHQFPFIENAEVVKDLANVLRVQYEENKGSDGTALISLSEDKVRDVLSPLDLSDEEIESVVLTYR